MEVNVDRVAFLLIILFYRDKNNHKKYYSLILTLDLMHRLSIFEILILCAAACDVAGLIIHAKI